MRANLHGRPRLRALTIVFLVAGLPPLTFAACGARDDIPDYPPEPPLPECVVDADCEGFNDLCRNVRCILDDGSGGQNAGGSTEGGSTATPRGLATPRGVCREVNPVTCDDDDICTKDECDPLSGACSHSPVTEDRDKDGHNGPREGTQFGDPDACGDDCDDTNPDAFPGNPEKCDGADNDCNGVVDDNASFVPLELNPVRISTPEMPPTEPGGLAWNGDSYVATFAGVNGSGSDIWRSQLAPDGTKLQADEVLKLSNSDAGGGALVWIGDRYGVAWHERRDGDYDIFFRLLDSTGATVETAPVQLCDAPEFSLYPDLAWTGSRFVVVWQDERSGSFRVYGRTITPDGALDSPELQLVPDGNFPDEAPAVAASSAGIGVAWGHGNAVAHFIQFQTFGFDLSPVSEVVTLTTGDTEAVYPSVVVNKNTYVVSWFDRSASPAGIYAAVIGQDGKIIVPVTAVSGTPPGRHARFPAMRPLGDRVLFVYADDRDDNDGYELYGRMVNADLSFASPEARITNGPGQSVKPKLAFGPDGNVGILFRDDREGPQHTFFTRLGCIVGN
ncbi:MAG: putative metal-binding motif-containing protein [Polyangiaceae bacterium]